MLTLKKSVLNLLVIALCLIAVAWVMNVPERLGLPLVTQQIVAILVGLAIGVAYLKYPYTERSAPLDIVLALVARNGATIDRTLLSVFTPSDEQREPALFAGPDGAARLVWTSKLDDLTGDDIRRVRVDITGDQIGPLAVPERVNVTTDGSQHSAAVWYGEDSGMIAFVTDGPPVEVRVRKIDAVGALQGAEVTAGTLEDSIDRLTLVGAGDKRYLAWEESGVSVVGRSMDIDGLSGVDFEMVVPDTKWLRPSLVTVGATVAITMMRQTGPTSKVVTIPITSLGQDAVGSELTDDITTIGAATASEHDAFTFWFSFYDEVQIPSALRLGLASPVCTEGPRVCGGIGEPQRVCVGFGATGYEAVPGATWCP